MDDSHPSGNQTVRRRWPVRVILFGFVVALVLPGIVFSGVLIHHIANVERTRSHEAARDAARRAADALDREIANLSAALVALATSNALARGDVASFYRQAQTVAASIGQALVLSDTAGQQLVNTRRPFGAPLPQMASVDAMRTAIRTRNATASNLFTGSTSGGPSIVVMYPVVLEGRVEYVLAISLQPLYLSGLLRNQGWPPGWQASVIDANGIVIGRSLDPERFIGQPATRPTDRPLSDEDVWVATTLEGTSVLAATRRLRLADWRVAVGVSIRTIEAPVRTTVMLLAIAGAVTLAVAGVLAWRLARSVTRPLHELAAAGTALGRGLPAPPVDSAIAEVDSVSRAVVQAAQELLRARQTEQRFADGLEAKVAERTAAAEASAQLLRDEMAARAAAEDQLHQVQKMEAVGQLTGGIAHDFNNLLTIVIGSLDLLRRRAQDDRTRRLLDNALEGAARAATLTARLLAFSRRQPLSPQAVDVNKLVAGMSDLLHRTLGAAVQLETVLAGGVWQAHVDPNQLENALLNLSVNGRDAIIEASEGGSAPGRLVIETANAVLDAGFAPHDPDFQAGEYVRIAVTDSGSGMPPEVVARVFEPFFTTKPQGQGTGLGLSQVHGFVKQSGGLVTIRTAPGEGTTVSIHLPRLQAGMPAAADAVADPAPEPAHAGLTVLVVEDDNGVRRYSVEALRDLGHMVLEAESAPAALRLLDAHPEIDLLLTDVALPGMDGPTLAAEARLRRPTLPVLFASGYTGDEAMRKERLPPSAPLLQKPFTVQALAAKIQETV